MKEIWLYCPRCGKNYWHVWEYDWDILARCYHCKNEFEFEHPEEEEEDEERNP